MKKKITFTKLVATGNDFVVVDNYHKNICLAAGRQGTSQESIAKKICERKYGVGADGLLFLEKSEIADVKMRIFNADGSEAEMCGNGARCVALYKSQVRRHRSGVNIETRAGVIESIVSGNEVKIKLTDPKHLKLAIPIKVNNRLLKVNFINTGVPHAVIFVEGLDKIDVDGFGREIRFHKKFQPAGTNVNFVEVMNGNSIRVRTYERGVEAETLACGTGSAASALITNYQLPVTDYRKINVYTRSGEILQVYFKYSGNKFTDVWLQGKANIVFKGEFLL